MRRYRDIASDRIYLTLSGRELPGKATGNRLPADDRCCGRRPYRKQKRSLIHIPSEGWLRFLIFDWLFLLDCNWLFSMDLEWLFSPDANTIYQDKTIK